MKKITKVAIVALNVFFLSFTLILSGCAGVVKDDNKVTVETISIQEAYEFLASPQGRDFTLFNNHVDLDLDTSQSGSSTTNTLKIDSIRPLDISLFNRYKLSVTIWDFLPEYATKNIMTDDASFADFDTTTEIEGRHLSTADVIQVNGKYGEAFRLDDYIFEGNGVTSNHGIYQEKRHGYYFLSDDSIYSITNDESIYYTKDDQLDIIKSDDMSSIFNFAENYILILAFDVANWAVTEKGIEVLSDDGTKRPVYAKDEVTKETAVDGSFVLTVQLDWVTLGDVAFLEYKYDSSGKFYYAGFKGKQYGSSSENGRGLGLSTFLEFNDTLNLEEYFSDLTKFDL